MSVFDLDSGIELWD